MKQTLITLWTKRSIKAALLAVLAVGIATGVALAVTYTAHDPVNVSFNSIEITGDDGIVFDSGDDTIDMDDGEDTIHLGAGDDIVDFGWGYNTLEFGGLGDSIDFLAGDDDILFRDGDDDINFGSGTDRVLFGGGDASIDFGWNAALSKQQGAQIAYAHDDADMEDQQLTIATYDGDTPIEGGIVIGDGNGHPSVINIYGGGGSQISMDTNGNVIITLGSSS